jgi:hypothetical protein
MGAARRRDVRWTGFGGRAALIALGVLLGAFVAACNSGLTVEIPDGANAGGGGAGGSVDVADAATDLRGGSMAVLDRGLPRHGPRL